jgi:tryptophan synthase alpha chain
MTRLAAAFARTRQEGRAAFVAYLCAGDPTFEVSLAACRAVLDAGVDVLELGVPFSDPLADGPTNQLAAQRALATGMTPARVLELVRQLRATSQVPVVLYTYYNLVFANGVEPTVRAAKEAGVDGMLVLDLPPEESGEFSAAAERHGIAAIRLVAPTTPTERLPRICEGAGGFIYYVSREGVTGAREGLASGIGAAVQRIKAHTALPVVVGFGISTPAQVEAVARQADGVVVGSALVNVICDHLATPELIPAEIGRVAAELVGGVRGLLT